jgi:Icc-related predicted phosphoesterase
MRTLICSDLHDDFKRFPVDKFPDADLCLVAGDLTEYGLRGRQKLSASDVSLLQHMRVDPAAIQMWLGDEIKRATDWLTRLAQRLPVYWIPGNHDIGVKNDTFGTIPNCTGILDLTVEAAGFRLHGVSMAPCYDAPFLADQWDYMTAEKAVEEAYYNFEPVDIVISHAPPYGHCDLAAPIIGAGEARHIGSRSLLEYIQRCSPKVVVCGHVHEASGRSEISSEHGVTTVYNVACRWQLIDIEI